MRSRILREFYDLYDIRDLSVFFRLKQWKSLISSVFGEIRKVLYTKFNTFNFHRIIKIITSKECKYIQKFTPM